MDAWRYYPTSPGNWNQMDSSTRDVLLLDFSYASWINLTLSGARGKMNSSIDTVVTFPHLTRTNRSFSVTNYTRISKYQRPQDGIIEQRRNSAHYELQKAVPVQSNEATSDLQSPSQFQPGFLVLVGQRGQSAIDSDFIARLTPRWRVKCCTNASSRRKLNDVAFSVELDSPVLSAESGFSTANELFARLVRRVSPLVSLAGEFHSKHYPQPKGSQLKGITDNRISLAVRFSNMDLGHSPSVHVNTLPFEFIGLASPGHHFGASACLKTWKERLALAFSWKRRWNAAEHKVELGARLNFTCQDIPSSLKLTLSSHAGIAAFLGCRLSELGIGLGVSVNPNTAHAQAALFLDI